MKNKRKKMDEKKEKKEERKNISPSYTVQCTIFDMYKTRKATFKKTTN